MFPAGSVGVECTLRFGWCLHKAWMVWTNKWYLTQISPQSHTHLEHWEKQFPKVYFALWVMPAVFPVFVVPSLMGSMALSNHYRSEDLLDIDTAAGGFQQRLGLKQCLPLTFCIHTGLSQYMALESVEGRNKYEIFYQCPVRKRCFCFPMDLSSAAALVGGWSCKFSGRGSTHGDWLWVLHVWWSEWCVKQPDFRFSEYRESVPCVI